MGFWSKTGDKVDRVMCAQEAREHDQAAKRAQRRGDVKVARELRAEADRLRRIANGS